MERILASENGWCAPSGRLKRPASWVAVKPTLIAATDLSKRALAAAVKRGELRKVLHGQYATVVLARSVGARCLA